MIVAEKKLIRTPVEELYLGELVEEDANFLLYNQDSNDDDMVVDNATSQNSIFDDNSSFEDILNDEIDNEVDDEYEANIFGD